MIGIKRVRTRDNLLIAFDRRKIVAAITEAMAAAEQGSGELAEELADAVCHFLDHASHRNSTEAGDLALELDTIHDMVEKVLMETGHRELARNYILLRDKRARLRRRIRVVRGDSAENVFVEGRADGEGAPWRRQRIAAALIAEADCDEETSDEISEVIERRVFQSGLGSISTALIRELVNSELFERGLTAALKRQSSVALPKFDLELLLYHGGDRIQGLSPVDPQHLSELVGDLIFRNYALDEVFSREVARAHRRGTIHLHLLERSLYLTRATVDARTVTTSGTVGEGSFFGGIFRTVRSILGSVSEEIEVCGLGEGLAHWLGVRDAAAGAHDESRNLDGAATDFLAMLEDVQGLRDALPGRVPQVILRIPFTPKFLAAKGTSLFGEEALREEISLPLVETVRRALLRREGQRLLPSCPLRIEVSPRTFTDRRFRIALEETLSLLPPEVPLFFGVDVDAGPERERDSGVAGSVSSPPPIAGKVTLNLVRVALEALRAKEPDPCGRFPKLISLALEAIRERAGFLDRVALHPDGPLALVLKKLDLAGHRDPEAAVGPLRAAAAHAIGILGLDDAVCLMTGESLHESETARAQGRRWIAALDRALSSARTASDPPVFLEESVNRGLVRRLEALDHELFADVLNRAVTRRIPSRGEDRHERPTYTSGVRFARWAPVDPLESWMHRESYRGWVRLVDRLDDASQLRKDGVEVLVAFLEEIACGPLPQGSGARRHESTTSELSFEIRRPAASSPPRGGATTPSLSRVRPSATIQSPRRANDGSSPTTPERDAECT